MKQKIKKIVANFLVRFIKKFNINIEMLGMDGTKLFIIKDFSMLIPNDGEWHSVFVEFKYKHSGRAKKRMLVDGKKFTRRKKK